MTSPNRSPTDAIAESWPPELWRDVHVTVALSGGADSVALLRAMLEMKNECGGRGVVGAAHVNHQLRGEESEADAAWCERFCRQLQVPLSIHRANTTDQAATAGDGLEAAARSLRYELLTSAAEHQGSRYLVTAHTQDDQVETVLMRILRGSGLRGVSGIPAMRPLTPTLTLVRPLLGCSRVALESYLARQEQTYRTDRSNTSPTFTRNRVRHELLPQLREQFNPEIDAALLRLATQAEQAEQFLADATRALLADCDVRISAKELSLAVAPLADQPTIAICEVVRSAWREAKLPEQAMSYHWWQCLAQLCSQPKVLNLPGKVRAEIIDGRLVLCW